MTEHGSRALLVALGSRAESFLNFSRLAFHLPSPHNMGAACV